MTKHILIAVGTARPNGVGHKIAHDIEARAEQRGGITTSHINLGDLELPFYNNENSPSSPDYVAVDEHVIAWGKLVAEADAVLFVTPEYNHNLSGVQKNAIDSLFAEWDNKPVGVVAYGWSAGVHSVAALKELAPVVKFDLREPIAELAFTKDISTDGSILDEAAVTAKIDETLQAL